MLERKWTILTAALLAFALSTGASNAACKSDAETTASGDLQQEDATDTAKSAQEVVAKMVENATEAPSGSGEKYVGSGPAKPVENWFGCKPGNEKCLSEKGQQQAEAVTQEPLKQQPDYEMAKKSEPCSEAAGGTN